MERKQFGRPLCEFQGLQWKFADMALKLESAQLLLYRAAVGADTGLPSAYDTTLAKFACNQAGFEVACEAVQMMGGIGYTPRDAGRILHAADEGLDDRRRLGRDDEEPYGRVHLRPSLQPAPAEARELSDLAEVGLRQARRHHRLPPKRRSSRARGGLRSADAPRSPARRVFDCVSREFGALPTPLHLFKDRSFLAYWLAGLSANVGWQFQLVGASWLMTELGRTPELVALVQTSVTLPVMLLSLPGGAISDTIGHRTLVLWAQAFLLSVSAALALLAYLDLLTPALLLLCTFLIGSARALYYPGWQAIVFEFLPRSQIATAVALNASNLNIARSLGPALGGAVLATAGAFMAFVINALSNVGVILIARRWPKPATASDILPEPFGIAVVGGIRYVALSPSLLILMLRSGVFNIAAIAIIALMPLVARNLLDGGPQTYGLLLGAFGMGAVAGALTIDGARRLAPTEPLVALGFLGFAAACLLLSTLHHLAVALIASTLAGVAWIYVQVTLYSIVQLSSPRWVLSRTIAIYQAFVFGGNAIGSLIWGMLAGAQGTAISLAAAGVFMAAGSILGAFFKIIPPPDDFTEPAAQWVAPSPVVAMTNRSGPILTTIHWRISQEDVPAFLEAMREKRRVRKRDGAANWTLSRDIQDPLLWYERFEVATWSGAFRLHSRRT